MDKVIKTFIEEDVSAEQFLSFVKECGIQDDAFIQEILNQIIMRETSRNLVYPRAWTADDADDMLELLKSPEKPQTRAPLKEIQTNTGPSQMSVGGYTCQQCAKLFTHKWKVNRHVADAHNKVTHTCSKCDKTFAQKRNLHQHESICQGIVTFPCDQCTVVLKTARELEFHSKKHKVKAQKKPRNTTAAARNSPQPGPSSYNCRQCPAKFQHLKQMQVHNARQHGGGRLSVNCRRCPAQFSDRQQLHAHNAQHHYQAGSGLHAEPFQQGHEPWVNEDGTVDEGLRDCYRTNRALILERYREGPVESIYNIPMYPGMRLWDIGQALQGIYDRQRHAFKVNISFGFIMLNVESGDYRFFRPYDNVNVFDAPILISRRSDSGKVLKKLKELDVMAEMSKNRHNTKWRLVLLTNIRVKVYSTNFFLGVAVQLRIHITRCKAIISLDKDPVCKKAYNDNLCLFRRLCLHRHGSLDKVQELLEQWQSRCTDQEREVLSGNDIPVASRFNGVQLQDLPELEQCFEINVQMYSLQEDGSVFQVFKYRLSRC